MNPWCRAPPPWAAPTVRTPSVVSNFPSPHCRYDHGHSSIAIVSTITLPSRRRVALSLGQSFGLSLLVIACGIAFSRSMTMAQYGELEAALGALAIAGVIAGLGMDAFAIRALRTSIFRKTWSEGRGFRHIAPRLLLVAAVLTWAVLVGFHAVIQDKTAVRLASFAAVLALLPLTAFSAYLLNAAKAHGASMQAKNALYLKGHGLLLGLIVLAHWIFGSNFGVLHAAVVLAIAWALSCGLLLRVNAKVEDERFRSGDRTYRHWSWIRSGLAFMVCGLMLMALDRGGVIVLGWMHADAEASARFGAASRLSWPVAFLAIGAHGTYLPLLSDAIDHGHRTIIDSVRRAWTRMLWLPIVGCVIVIGALGGWMLSFYGDGFAQAHGTLLVLLIGQAVAAMAFLSLPLLVYRGHGLTAVIVLVSWVVIGGAGMVLGGHFAADFGVAPDMGVAIGQVIGMIGAQATLYASLHRRLPNAADDEHSPQAQATAAHRATEPPQY